MSTVLVLDSNAGNALPFVRSLGKAGLRVIVGIPTKDPQAPVRPNNPAALSRFTSAICGYRRADQAGLDAFVADIKALVEQHDIQVVFPLGLVSVAACTLARDSLMEVTRIPFPDFSILERAHDKAIMLDYATAAGVSIPQSDVVDSEEALKAVLPNYRYPLVIKARRNSGIKGWRVVESEAEAIAAYHEMVAQRGDGSIKDFTRPLVQEFIPGPIYDACVAAQDGELKAFVGQKRVLTIPEGGGPGILNETVDRPDLLDIAQRLVKETNWSGFGQIELKEDANGELKLMELNSKFWGTIGLSIHAGVDMPLLAYKHALGEDLPQDLRYKVGVRYSWFFPLGLRVLGESQNKPGLLREFLRKRAKSDLQFSDLRPSAYLLLQNSPVGLRSVGKWLRRQLANKRFSGSAQ